MRQLQGLIVSIFCLLGTAHVQAAEPAPTTVTSANPAEGSNWVNSIGVEMKWNEKGYWMAGDTMKLEQARKIINLPSATESAKSQGKDADYWTSLTCISAELFCSYLTLLEQAKGLPTGLAYHIPSGAQLNNVELNLSEWSEPVREGGVHFVICPQGNYTAIPAFAFSGGQNRESTGEGVAADFLAGGGTAKESRKDAHLGFRLVLEKAGAVTSGGMGTSGSDAAAVKMALEKSFLPNSAEDCFAQGLDDMSKKRLDEAFLNFKKAAEMDPNNADYASAVGACYADGTGTAKDPVQMVVWTTKAASLGKSSAQYFLSRIYRGGWGIPSNLPLANEWLQKAADKGDSDALSHMASFYIEGINGFPQDYAKAYEWAKKGVGSRHCIYLLGLLTWNGWGVTKNEAEARRLWQSAADLGDNAAKNALEKSAAAQ
ncbi:MAG: tetratricopeptide repeat protein [Methylacidiphilales bacterium]|nr:tetratricopeptide repeat protein [Candidatus Methylacidiphilales bacterium]